jgi:hypothetical protein
MRIPLAGPFVAALLFGAPVAAQTVTGTVRDAESRAPVVGAEVSVSLPGGGRIDSEGTDAAGGFLVRAWRAGTFTVEVNHPSYRPTTVAVSAGLAERVEVTILLSPTAMTLDPLEVHGRTLTPLPDLGLAGFEERRRWGELLGIGRFLRAEQIETRGSFEIALGSVPGLRVIDHPACKGTKMVVAGRTNSSLRGVVRGSPPPCSDMSPMLETSLGICRITFVVDGVRAHLAGTQRIDDLVPFSLVSAIEVYRTPAELPAEYSGHNSRCGVVAIWTRRGGS